MRVIFIVTGFLLLAGGTGGCTHQWFRQRPHPLNLVADVLEGAGSAAVVVPSAALLVPDRVVHAVASAVDSPPPPEPVEADAAVAQPPPMETDPVQIASPLPVYPDPPKHPQNHYLSDYRGLARKRLTPGNLVADLLEGSFELVWHGTTVVTVLATTPLFILAEVIHQEPRHCHDRLHQAGWSGPKWVRTEAEKRHRAALVRY